ncbi:hypothetical protein A2U01_0106820 [Trifolium medium]|uniref:Uncharacterized protein n=1 Tax=Trifolium medium TaxID=97028 RepID=A0A392VF08_9FABA|nr:hypothetical protein [Trifolium medium]
MGAGRAYELPAAPGVGSWARGANMSRNTTCCSRRRPMGAGRAYELGRFGCC